MGIAAMYLLYISYELFQGREDTNTTMTPAARILFIALFVVSAIALLWYTVHIWRQSAKEDGQEQPKDDPNSLK